MMKNKKNLYKDFLKYDYNILNIIFILIFKIIYNLII